jgi:hypothetical protein
MNSLHRLTSSFTRTHGRPSIQQGATVASSSRPPYSHRNPPATPVAPISARLGALPHPFWPTVEREDPPPTPTVQPSIATSTAALGDAGSRRHGTVGGSRQSCRRCCRRLPPIDDGVRCRGGPLLRRPSSAPAAVMPPTSKLISTRFACNAHLSGRVSPPTKHTPSLAALPHRRAVEPSARAREIVAPPGGRGRSTARVAAGTSSRILLPIWWAPPRFHPFSRIRVGPLAGLGLRDDRSKEGESI